MKSASISSIIAALILEDASASLVERVIRRLSSQLEGEEPDRLPPIALETVPPISGDTDCESLAPTLFSAR